MNALPDQNLFAVESDAALALLSADITSPLRTEPIVCLTSRPRDALPALDPTDVRAIVGTKVPIYFVPTGEPSRILQELLPEKLHVFGGAARIWWPGAGEHSLLSDHPLILDRYGVYGSQALQHLRRAWQRGAPVESDRAANPVVEQLAHERDAVTARNQRLAEENAQLQADLARARERAAAAERRLRDESRLAKRVAVLEPDAEETLDPVGEFLLLIYAEWVRMGFDARETYPLLRHRLGAEFLRSTQEVETLSLERVAWVCSRVATGLAHTVNGLEPHPLRDGRGGNNPQRQREDGAMAWRCALKRGMPNAPRLHYWLLEDGSIEWWRPVVRVISFGRSSAVG